MGPLPEDSKSTPKPSVRREDAPTGRAPRGLGLLSRTEQGPLRNPHLQQSNLLLSSPQPLGAET